ncbi:MAG: pyridinium-3,5-bisthiocarboxylic acid mononucleotide nickel chelatase [Actinomycetota bacterium]|jgi:uncharacterized protein (TIGR00299 family) protein|nr:pyridinium-3,5-bisthiocarboxylic acid mononucleotide nickel chelatase [Actinomycetota bacterium]
MFLGALVDVGVPIELMQSAIDALGVELITLRAEHVTRSGLGATRVHVDGAEATASRTWPDVRRIIESAELDSQVRSDALDVFARLAEAEAAVHRVGVEEVHFHEVGALDALADVVATAAALRELALTALIATPVSLGSGSTRGAHGPLPVPVPAVLALLAGAPVRAGVAPHEMTTPTGAALLATVVTGWGDLPPMRVTRTGMGAGGRDPQEVANVLRLVVGEPLEAAGSALLVETNVDDLDPRLWPGVLQRLLEVGASDAWLTPILMKKGRPAHTLSVLCTEARADEVQRVVFTETSTIGVRIQRIGKRALHRSESTVEVDGQTIRIKVAVLDGQVVNTNPEYDDVAAAAQALDRPVKTVLAQAVAAAQTARKNARAPD